MGEFGSWQEAKAFSELLAMMALPALAVAAVLIELGGQAINLILRWRR